MNRRAFLTGAAAAAGWLVAHPRIGAAGTMPAARAVPRIASLELRTAASFDAMARFYGETLGLSVLDRGSDRLTLGGGETPITFVAAEPSSGNPFYHFAFNIPENKVVAARDWQKARTALIPPPEALRDPDYPDDVVHFRHWNAHSVFFFDPAENVVEYIGRHDLGNAAPGTFGTEDILYASEIGFVVDDVPSCAKVLRTAAGVENYRGGSDEFTAVGDEHGLLLVFRRGRKLSLAAERTKTADVFPTVARVRGAAPGRPAIPDYPYEVVVG